jgi:hypothetical protein
MATSSKWTDRWDWLDKFPATNAKIFAGIVLGYLTGVVYLLGIILQRDAKIDGEIWIAWLTFILALDGIAAWQYGKKRDTYVAPSPDSERADVPVPPAPTKPAEPGDSPP